MSSQTQPVINVSRAYSSVVKNTEYHAKREIPPSFRVVIKPKERITADETRKFIKENINPVKLGVGITRMTSSSDGTIIMQSTTKIDSEKIAKEINEKFHNSLSAEIGSKFRPRLIIYDIPQEVTKENVVEIIKEQNKEIIAENSYLQVRAVITNRVNKNRRNLIIEVDSGLRRSIVTNGLKIMFTVCRADDNYYVRRCYKCNRFHPGKQSECSNAVTCPQCMGSHDLKTCTANREVFKCINCFTFNERTRLNKKLDHNHYRY
ncbi:hypothetical protein GE061_015906 [Apolygus lucorum]|uniref:Pre-C2HC domain-containing protein n=1 Tax=Apolygus lucorum TaxID=248454 RepID=A0A8S9XEH8_APOLU|nr:hypothetical protein GE061_015906 [Apolygus lucorum]